jgi:acetyl-CoA carboxylase biotin carboxyl carrier protein
VPGPAIATGAGGLSPAAPATAPGEPAPPADDDTAKITSPMVGTFYTAANPDADPFVRPGTRVGPDDVVCVVEAMKVFNEIKAETAGVIDKVLVANGQAIEFGQPLFTVRPE